MCNSELVRFDTAAFRLGVFVQIIQWEFGWQWDRMLYVNCCYSMTSTRGVVFSKRQQMEDFQSFMVANETP